MKIIIPSKKQPTNATKNDKTHVPSIFSTDGSIASNVFNFKTVQHKYDIKKDDNLKLSYGNNEDISPIIKEVSDMNLTVDVDGIFGPITFRDFGTAIIHSFDIKVTKSFINTKTEFVLINNLPINIRDIPHVQLGTIDLPAGKANVFYMCTKMSKGIDLSVIISYLDSLIHSASMVKAYRNKSNTSYVVNACSFSDFATYLISVATSTKNHHYDFIFIETFGNKNKMTVDYNLNIEDNIVNLINRNFKLDSFPFMKIDLCFNLASNGFVAFMNHSFFQNMNVLPNFFLFFNRNLANCHGSKTTMKNNQLVREFEIIEKVNFYSTLEDLLSVARDYKHLPKVSSEMMQSNVVDHHPIKSTRAAIKNMNKLSGLVNSLQSNKLNTWSYRIEVRIATKSISPVIDNINKALKKSQVYLYETHAFMKAAYNTARVLIGQIAVNNTAPIKSLFRSIVAEHLLVDCFCKGKSNLHSLPKSLHKMSRKMISDNLNISSITIDIDTLIENISSSDIQSTLVKMIDYNSSIKEKQKTILKNIFNIVHLNIEDASEMVIKQYCFDMCKRFKFKFDSGLSVLHSLSHSSNTSFKMLKMDMVLVKLFGASNAKKWLELPYRCMMNLYLIENNIEFNSWINSIKFVFIDQHIDLAFCILKDLKRKNLVKLINNTNSVVRTDIFDEELMRINRISLVNAFKNKAQCAPIEDKRIAWTDSERIRLLASRNYYKKITGSIKGVWTYASESSLFGFLLTRSPDQMKDAYVRITKAPEERLTFYNLTAQTWEPENYAIEDHILNMQRFCVQLNKDAIDLYRELYYNDIREYKSLIRSEYDNDDISKEKVPVSLQYSNIPAEISGNTSTDIYNILIGINERINTLETTILTSLKDFINHHLNPISNIDNFSVEFNPSSLEEINYQNIDIPQVESERYNSIVENLQSNNDDYNKIQSDEYHNKLFQKYRFRSFDALKSRASITSINNRPSIETWNNSINTLLSSNIIYRIQKNKNIYKFNLPVDSAKYLTFDYIMKYLKNKLTSNDEKVSSLRSGIRSSLRPSAEDWAMYLDDLEVDGLLKMTKIVKTQKFFTI